ncbi:MAG: glutamate racemase [FCB group bacterium]|nr:glutamate racemase [FCB group bacterium]
MDESVGIFDSGVGGLTVLRRIAERLPSEPLVYLGDTARVPYGTKSADTVVRYARACADILLKRGIKLLVVACNTASAHALDVLRDELPVPVLGVIEPGARRAVEATRNGRIGVIGTAGTIGSGSYQAAIQSLRPDAQVLCRACPLFVPLAEEGWTQGPVPLQVAHEYLDGLVQDGIDTLVLGCTHYPILRDVIAEALGDGVTVVDSAEATSVVVEEVLDSLGLRADENERPDLRFLSTDAPQNLAHVGELFLGKPLIKVEWVDI